MRAYGDIGKKCYYGYYDDTYVDRGRINQIVKKEIDTWMEVYEARYDEDIEDFLGCECYMCAQFDLGGEIPYDKYLVKYVPL